MRTPLGWAAGIGPGVPGSGHGGCVSPPEAACDERAQGPERDAHGGGGHEQPNDGQGLGRVVLGHQLTLRREPECQETPSSAHSH